MFTLHGEKYDVMLATSEFNPPAMIAPPPNLQPVEEKLDLLNITAPAPPTSTKLATPLEKEELGKKLLIFTSYTKDNPVRAEMSRSVAKNQRDYARLYGYSYQEYPENLAVELNEQGEVIKSWLPYWSKIAGINRILNHEEKGINTDPDWIVWMDDDAVVTNPKIKMEDVIYHYKGQDEQTYFIVTEDSQSQKNKNIPLNSAILFIKNNEWSRDFFKKIWEMRTKPVPGRLDTYGDCPNQSCLHEQQAITDLIAEDALLPHTLK